MKQTYSISDLAREFEVTPRTIRFYEAEGLLSPLREGQRRIYRSRDRTRLKLILRGKRLGFLLSEIREIIDLYGAAEGEAAQLDYLIQRIAERRAELMRKRQDIEESLWDLENVERNCRKRLSELDKSDLPKKQDQRQGRFEL